MAAPVQSGHSVRRKFPRRGFRRSLSALCKGQYIIGEGVELGEGGVSFRSEFLYTVGQDVVVNFQLPNASFVSVRAQIRNVTKDKNSDFHLIGLAFSNLKFEFKREIRTYVSARSSSEQ